MQILHNTLSKFKSTQVYSLDVIISVGYRAKSKRGTQFRIWANQVLKQYLLQGYAINERIADNTLVALTLMIAESRTEEKDTMVKVIVNLINKNN